MLERFKKVSNNLLFEAPKSEGEIKSMTEKKKRKSIFFVETSRTLELKTVLINPLVDLAFCYWLNIKKKPEFETNIKGNEA